MLVTLYSEDNRGVGAERGGDCNLTNQMDRQLQSSAQLVTLSVFVFHFENNLIVSCHRRDTCLVTTSAFH